MELGLIGLGRMGANMTRRLIGGGHRVVTYDRDPEAARAVEQDGAVGAADLQDLVAQLAVPRAILLMVPAGDPVTQTIEALAPLLSAGDTLIDGGNSYYRDSVARAAMLKARGLHYLD